MTSQNSDNQEDQDPNKEEKKCVKNKFGCILAPKNILIGAVLLIFIVQFFQIRSISSQFDFLQERDSSLITEIGELKQSYIDLGADLNEVRTFLRMPSKQYGFEEIENQGGDEAKNENDLQLALFQYMEYLASSDKIENDIELISGFLEDLQNSDEIIGYLTEVDLFVSEISEDETKISLRINDEEGNELVTFVLSKEDGILTRKTYFEEETIDVEDSKSFIEDTLSYLKDNIEKLKNTNTSVNEFLTNIVTTINAGETQAVLSEKEITISDDYKISGKEIVYQVFNKDDELIGEIKLNIESGEISLVDKNNEDTKLTVTDITTSLVPFLEDLDTKTLIEKKVTEAQINLEETLNDDGFKMMLEQSGISISSEVREDEDRIYYDILDKEDQHISSIVVEKATGVINIVQPDGANAENLLFFDPEYKKKTLEIPDEIPEYGEELAHSDNTFNILIAGKHGNLVDTMIFAHLDEDKGTVRMISIPRDLHYNGRKINSFPYFYGMPELKKVLSDMTGYKLDKYILIDMYAFIDVIDLIGGIDVHLDKAVIDPTYRTVDDGVVGTLHYEPGDYHLGGVEALRLARSRHTSSDFARAERQQLIIESIQNKAQNFGFGDADTIYEIAKTVLDKTETDITLDEAISYYFRYQNFDIISNNVMSSGNVLYVPPYITVEQCNAKIAAAESVGQPIPDCMNQNHAYTLLPKNNNWNIIKWYFAENFEESFE